MSSIRISHTKKALPDPKNLHYRAWQLLVSATDADKTNGVDDDPNVFVMRTDRRANPGEDREVFSHVASLYEMNNHPISKADIPPKSVGFYRSSILKLDFQNTPDLDDALLAIKTDVNLLMKAASNGETEDSEVLGYHDIPDGEFNTFLYGVSGKEFGGLTGVDLALWSVEFKEAPAKGHAGSLIPDNEYIYIAYPADRGECLSFSLGGFETTAWSFDIQTHYDDATEQDQTFIIYRTDHKLGQYPGEINYEIS